MNQDHVVLTSGQTKQPREEHTIQTTEPTIKTLAITDWACRMTGKRTDLSINVTGTKYLYEKNNCIHMQIN